MAMKPKVAALYAYLWRIKNLDCVLAQRLLFHSMTAKNSERVRGAMKTRKKSSVDSVAKMIVKMVRDGMKGLDPGEQERRLKSFCDAVGGRRRTRSSTSEFSRPGHGRMAARARE